METTNLLTNIAKILDKLKIPYVITGGMAVSVWGRIRFTADIDIVVELLPKNVKVLVKELMKLDKDVYISEDAIMEALKYHSEFNFIDPNSQMKVDFWVVNDQFNKEKIKRGITKKIQNQKVVFISPEDLIVSKLLWHQESESTRQLEDIEGVLSVSKVDLKYVKTWATKHGTIETLERLRAQIKAEK